jgi:hypothetical protein
MTKPKYEARVTQELTNEQMLALLKTETFVYITFCGMTVGVNKEELEQWLIEPSAKRFWVVELVSYVYQGEPAKGSCFIKHAYRESEIAEDHVHTRVIHEFKIDGNTTFSTREPTKIGENKPVVSETPKPKKEYPPLTDAQKQAILMSLHHMCSCDGDMARELNGVGFSKMDTTIGHSLNNWAKSHGELTEKQYKLALMLLKKYKNQIAIEDYTCIYGDQQNEKNKHLAALAVRDANSERNEDAKTAPRTNGKRNERDDKRSKQA